MLNEKIGKNAGNIWNTLKEKGPMTISALKKICKLNDREMYLGLGWLAREGKLKFEEKGNHLAISLVE
jgi:hypothetical protein